MMSRILPVNVVRRIGNEEWRTMNILGDRTAFIVMESPAHSESEKAQCIKSEGGREQ